MNEIKLIIDNNIVSLYIKYYFKKYPKRKKKPITKPIPPSLNQWMVMNRFQMNHEKQAWKEFGEWLVKHNGLENKQISKCDIVIQYFFPDKRRRDLDNFVPKNLFDSFTESGLLVDDDYFHVESLTLKGDYSKDHTRTEITLFVKEI